MASVTVDADRLAMIFRSSEFKSALNELGQKAVEEAQAIAPVRSGHYRDALTYIVGTDTKSGAMKIQVQANDFKSNWVEFGTVKEGAQHVLRRMGESVFGEVSGGDKT